MTNKTEIITTKSELILPNKDLTKSLDKFDFKDLLENAWLNLDVDESTLPNPLENIPDICKDNPELYIIWLMTRPEYFYLTCKVLLNVNILPFQGVILEQLWKHKFPMLIGSRGMSKSFLLAIYTLLRLMFLQNRKIVIAGAGFRQSKIVFQYMETIANNSPILKDYLKNNNGKDSFRKGTDEWRLDIGSSNVIAIPIGSGDKIRGKRANDILADEFSCLAKDTLVQTDEGLIEIKDYLNGDVNSLLNMDGDFEIPNHIFRTPKVDVYKVTTDYGYSFKCSEIHQVNTNNGWKKLTELEIGNYLEIDFNDYFPQRYKKYRDIQINEDMGWLMGLLISEGTVTNRNFVNITNTDEQLIDSIINKFPNITWKKRIREAYTDNRGWKCKECFDIQYCDTEFRTALRDAGVDYVTSHEKSIPSSILQSPRSVVVKFLKGLFDGDGSIFSYDKDKVEKIGINYTSVSEKLINSLQILLLKFGIFSSKVNKTSAISLNTQWQLSMRGYNAIKLKDLIYNDVFNDIKRNIGVFRKPSIRKSGNSFICSSYRCDKNVYLGSFKTEQECVDAFNTYWSKTRECLKIRSIEKLPEQEVLYDFHLPKTHSFIGNGFVQHNSMLIDIFETVISGFGAVSSAPEKNVKRIAAEKLAKKMNLRLSDFENFIEPSSALDNQIVISGTAYYDFNHFSKYHDKWKAIIKTKGDRKKLKDLFGGDELSDSFKSEDYSIIRLPYELIPEGFMDDAQISRSKATMHSGNFEMEFGAIFSKDSLGFFKRTLVESCVVNEDKKITIDNKDYYGDKTFFEPKMYGDKNKTCVMGVDPAIAADNFAIVILEIDPPFRKIVYCWVTNKKDHMEKIKLGLVQEHNYYAYAARKIRELCKQFNCVRIAIDSEGGGRAILESLRDEDKLRPGDLPIYHIINPNKPNFEEDGLAGLHIIDEISFSNGTWVSDANHGMKKDMEDNVLLFPFIDSISFAEASYEDEEAARLYDTEQQNIRDIEEIKNELITIVVTETKTGRESFDTPEIKTGTGRKGRMKKDRYSALLMANMTGRQMMNNNEIELTMSAGGFASSLTKKDDNNGTLFIGPSFIVDKLSNLYR